MLTNCFAIFYVFFFFFFLPAWFNSLIVSSFCAFRLHCCEFLMFDGEHMIIMSCFVNNLTCEFGLENVNWLFCNLICFYCQPDLNKFLALGRPAWKEARATLQKLLSGMLIISWILLLVWHLFFVLNYMRQSLNDKKKKKYWIYVNSNCLVKRLRN